MSIYKLLLIIRLDQKQGRTRWGLRFRIPLRLCRPARWSEATDQQSLGTQLKDKMQRSPVMAKETLSTNGDSSLPEGVDSEPHPALRRWHANLREDLTDQEFDRKDHYIGSNLRI